jgi:hypothetical protein
MTTTTQTKPARKTWRDKPPSQRSIDYLTDMVKKHQANPFGLDEVHDLKVLAGWFAEKTRTQGEVSDLIDQTKAKPKRSAPVPVAPVAPKPAPAPFVPVPDVVPSAKFAILTELLTQAPDAWRKQEYLFFEVKKLPKKDARVVLRLTGGGSWAGKHGPKFVRTKLPYALRAELLGHLENEAFAYQASLTFAEIHTLCGRCAAELTDDLSREHKFGLTCWNLMAPLRAKLEAMEKGTI